MITSIQLHENVKHALDHLKERKTESYESVILRLIEQVELQKRTQRAFMIESCKAMAHDNLALTKEWEAIDFENWPE